MPRAREAAERALALDDGLSEAHSALAYWHLIYDWDWEAARAGFERTLELNPNDAMTMHHFGHLYHGFVSCQFEEGLALCARSVDVDPLAPYAKHGYYANLLIMGRYEEAIARLTAELARDPAQPHARRILGNCYLETERYEEAGKTIELAVHTSGRHPWAVFELGMYHARTGNPEAARAIQAELEARGRSGYMQGTVLAVIPAWLGEMDEAFAHLERAYEERDGVLIALTTWPGFRAAWEDPRYEEMLARLKLFNPRRGKAPRGT
jgi:tetratricopeptide (TPR) repeat protein